MKRFWNWKQRIFNSGETVEETNILTLNGTIAEESWWDDEVTPQIFKEELMSKKGNVEIRINSPGGDCIAAAQIYNMIRDYNRGTTTAFVDGIAASAASVVCMAADKVVMSPVGMMMIHNPSTFAWGDASDMQKAIDTLNEVKESIINAYEIKTGNDRKTISKLMDKETWMNAKKAVELGFADEILDGETPDASSFDKGTVENNLKNKMEKAFYIPKAEPKRAMASELLAKLEDLNK